MRSFLFSSAICCVSAIALMSCATPEAPVAPAPAVAQVAPVPPAPPVVKPPAPTPVAVPAVHPGEAVYKASCAACHDNTEATRAPSRDNLKGMSFQFVNYALTQGKMKDIGASLSAEQRAQVVSFVTGGRDPSQVTADWTKGMMCT